MIDYIAFALKGHAPILQLQELGAGYGVRYSGFNGTLVDFRQVRGLASAVPTFLIWWRPPLTNFDTRTGKSQL